MQCNKCQLAQCVESLLTQVMLNDEDTHKLEQINETLTKILIITTLTDMQTATIVHLNDTTNDDWDVYMEILDVTTQCAPITLEFLHVKGHQDKNKHHPLTVIEQLNVDCN